MVQGGAKTVVMGNGMTRAPLLRMASIQDAEALQQWLSDPVHFDAVARAFNSTTRFGRLDSVQCTSAGRNVYVRFRCRTGDAMGMNMITKVRVARSLFGRLCVLCGAAACIVRACRRADVFLAWFRALSG